MKIRNVFIFFIFGISFLSCTKKDAGEDRNIHEVQFDQIKPFANEITGSIKDLFSASKFEIRYSDSPDNGDTKNKEFTSINFEINDLKPATTYYLEVRAYSNSAWSEWSGIKKVKTADFYVSIETYNILSSKYDSQFPGHEWFQRRLAFKDIVLQPDNFPDVLAIQEAFINSQVNDVASLLDDQYDVHISSRETDARAILWKKDKYSLVEYDDNIAGYDNTISGHSQSKYITYVRLRYNVTGKNFLVFNIHPVAGANADASKARGVQARMIAD